MLDDKETFAHDNRERRVVDGGRDLRSDDDMTQPQTFLSPPQPHPLFSQPNSKETFNACRQDSTP
jgi:hypothetical protein